MSSYTMNHKYGTHCRFMCQQERPRELKYCNSLVTFHKTIIPLVPLGCGIVIANSVLCAAVASSAN